MWWSKIFNKICLKAIRDTFCLIFGMWSGERRGDKRGRSNILVCRWDPHPKPSPSLSGTRWFPSRKTLRRVIGLLTVMFLQRESESIFFQSRKFTECNIKDRNEVKSYLMVFDLLKITHGFYGKKQLRTKWNINCNSRDHVFGY